MSPCLLCIETSASHYSAALYRGTTLISCRLETEPKRTASMLAVSIDETLKEGKVSPSMLQAVAVAEGPGSFTGLRIGTATAKGLCFALEIPLIAVHTLYLMALQAKDILQKSKISNFLLCPMIDARRMEVYAQLYDENNAAVSPAQAIVIDAQSFEKELEKPVYFFGNGADKCRQVLAHPNVRFLNGIEPNADFMIEPALKKWNEKNFCDLASFEPYYLKDFLIRK